MFGRDKQLSKLLWLHISSTLMFICGLHWKKLSIAKQKQKKPKKNVFEEGVFNKIILINIYLFCGLFGMEFRKYVHT